MEKLKKLINCKESSRKEKEGDDKGKATEENIRTVGPWGGSKGDEFDDGTFSGIKEIKIGYDRWIHSILVIYDKDGNSTEQSRHGGKEDQSTRSNVKFAEIRLEYPQEFIIKVSGNYGAKDDPYGEPLFYFVNPDTDTYVRSLTFFSNVRTYGPYGVESGKSFSFTTDGGKIVGLMGRSDEFIDAIGFHLSAPVAPPPNPFRNGWAKVRFFCLPSRARRRQQEAKMQSQGKEPPKNMEPSSQHPKNMEPSVQPPKNVEPSSKDA